MPDPFPQTDEELAEAIKARSGIGFHPVATWLRMITRQRVPDERRAPA